MPLTKDQAEMLTALVIAARPTGARRWDGPGVLAALAKVRHLELAEVMMAAGRAARDRDLETPAAIGNPSAPCWIERPVVRPVPEKTTPVGRCGICSHPRHDGRCPRCPLIDDHMFMPDLPAKRGPEVTEIVAAVKAELTTPSAAPELRDDAKEATA